MVQVCTELSGIPSGGLEYPVVATFLTIDSTTAGISYSRNFQDQTFRKFYCLRTVSPNIFMGYCDLQDKQSTMATHKHIPLSFPLCHATNWYVQCYNLCLPAVIGQDYTLDNDTRAVYQPCTGSDCVPVQCIDLEIIDDPDLEGDHTFQIQINGLSLGSISQSLFMTTITITDNIGIYP